MTTPVLFLHGWAMRGDLFADVARRLGPDFDCHMPDMPGHGAAADQAGGLDACADLAAAWMSRLDRPIVVGWSMGAAIAWRLIERLGTSGMRGLVTLDMSPRMLPDQGWTQGLIARDADAIRATAARIVPGWQRMARSIAQSMFAEGSQPVPTRTEIADFLCGQDPGNLVSVWADLVEADARQGIAAIEVPYLVCAGAQSGLYPRSTAQWLVEAAPDATLALIEQAGHSPHLEQPEAFCDAICRFVAAKGLASSLTRTQIQPAQKAPIP
ncbi:alpha/beta fold hydrolase [Thalassobius sp. Cn5-15]|uniref:alpha/beta fold hydrolase n=1 Tax=Thalassobius sp. Cn5-15 TaxID=2917763 RepID=UPI001EF18FC8|nr:alpha/beta hydrolase [Thalassobius sp. Cn5-15]MCG7493272.1 alpha/beta hydrolase [Thalassobius sp. Cn5-15]